MLHTAVWDKLQPKLSAAPIFPSTWFPQWLAHARGYDCTAYLAYPNQEEYHKKEWVSWLILSYLWNLVYEGYKHIDPTVQTQDLSSVSWGWKLASSKHMMIGGFLKWRNYYEHPTTYIWTNVRWYISLPFLSLSSLFPPSGFCELRVPPFKFCRRLNEAQGNPKVPDLFTPLCLNT